MIRRRVATLWIPCAAITAGAILAPARASAAGQLVIFAFDQAADRLLRIQDRNNDGDPLDTGEITVFMTDANAQLGLENALGLVALGATRVLATDNVAPRNVLLLTDFNRDGDALDAGEAAEYWSGALPGGGTLALPAGLTRDLGSPLLFPDVFLIDNNALNTAIPEAIYRLSDLDQNGVIAAGEAQLAFTLSPAGTSATSVFDAEFDAAGTVFVLDVSDQANLAILIAAAGGSFTTWIDQGGLQTLTVEWRLDSSMLDMAFLSSTQELVVPVLRGAPGLTGLLALKDRDGDGQIAATDEWRVLWDEGTHAGGFSAGTARDVFAFARPAVPGGPPIETIVWADATTDRIWRLIDLDRDGDFNETGETTIAYDSAAAVAAGRPGATQFLSVTATIACSGDVDADGDVDLDDLLLLLPNFGVASGAAPDEGDLDLDGDVDLDDLLSVLGAFGGC